MGLTKRFGSLVALDDLTLDVADGEVFGFLGPNGAGKSTTLRLLLGFIRATAGTAEIKGIDTRDVEACHRHLAYVPGDVSLWPKLTGEECLELLGNLHGDVDVRLPRRARRSASTSSSTSAPARTRRATGRRSRSSPRSRREPDVLLLDEPTSGLDPLMEQEFRRCVSEAARRAGRPSSSRRTSCRRSSSCAPGSASSERATLSRSRSIDRLRAMRSTELEIDIDGRAPRSLSGRRRRQRVAHAHWRPSHAERPARPRAARRSTASRSLPSVAGGVARGDLPHVLRRRRPRVSTTAHGDAPLGPTGDGQAPRRARRRVAADGRVDGQSTRSNRSRSRPASSRTSRRTRRSARLYGTPFDLATPGGFTVWRLGMFLVRCRRALWGLLTATRLLRGEEEAGRADLVLTAPISRRRLTDVTLLVVAAAAPIVGAPVALGFIATAQAVPARCSSAPGITLLTLDFIADGGLTSQLFATRRRASGAGGLVLGRDSSCLRMVADGSSGLGWLRWLTPFGWLEELRPFADERACFHSLLLAALAVGLGGLALALSRQRDLGDGIVRERDTAELRPRLLHSPLGVPVAARPGRARRVGSRARRDWPRHRRHHRARSRPTSPRTRTSQDFVGRFGFGDLGTVAGFVGSMDVFRGNGGRAVRRDGDQPRLGGRAGTPARAHVPHSGHAARVARRIGASTVERGPDRQRRVRGGDRGSRCRRRTAISVSPMPRSDWSTRCPRSPSSSAPRCSSSA